MKIKTNCSNCKKDIIKYSRNKIIHNYFCSIKCKYEFKRKNTYIKLNCDYCGKEYEELKCVLKHYKKHYCSRECSNNSLKIKKIDVKCEQCGVIYKKHKCYQNKSKHNFCSTKCYNEYRYVDNYYNSNYRRLAFKKYKHECEICGWNNYNEVLEVHHIDENRYNNKLENLIILCPTCYRIITVGWGYIKNRKLKSNKIRTIKIKTKNQTSLKEIKQKIEDLKIENLNEYGIYAKMSRKWNVSGTCARIFIIKIKNYLNEGFSWDEILDFKIKCFNLKKGKNK